MRNPSSGGPSNAPGVKPWKDWVKGLDPPVRLHRKPQGPKMGRSSLSQLLKTKEPPIDMGLSENRILQIDRTMFPVKVAIQGGVVKFSEAPIFKNCIDIV